MPKGVYTRRISPTDGLIVNDDGTVAIPLRRRDGSVRAYVTVDAADAPFATQWRWSLNAGYAGRRLPRSDGPRGVVLLHRELLGLKPGDGLEGDHIDRDKLNCRRLNLRVVQHHGNTQNAPGWTAASSRFRGVCWNTGKQRWMAYVMVKGKLHNLGLFLREIEAAEAARLARARLLPYAVD